MLTRHGFIILYSWRLNYTLRRCGNIQLMIRIYHNNHRWSKEWSDWQTIRYWWVGSSQFVRKQSWVAARLLVSLDSVISALCHGGCCLSFSFCTHGCYSRTVFFLTWISSCNGCLVSSMTFKGCCFIGSVRNLPSKAVQKSMVSQRHKALHIFARF